MGLFPTKLTASRQRKPVGDRPKRKIHLGHRTFSLPSHLGRIKARTLAVATRQLATLVEAGLPLLRGLRLLQEQTEDRRLGRITGALSEAIESGSSFSEALEAHPKVFNQLYVSMVRAGEISGALELTLKRLAEFMEKSQRIKGKIKAAMFYPCAVLLVAVGIIALLMTYVLPKFKEVFQGLLNGARMPAFTEFVFGLSEIVKNHFFLTAVTIGAFAVAFVAAGRTKLGRAGLDRLKLRMPVLGPVFKNAAIGRFARTMATLTGSGVPILQALTIVKETAGNTAVADVISRVHENVKQGEPIAPTLKASGVFPVMIAGMVDVGEQTGALPEMLMKIADNCDEEVENAASAMTSLLEPIMIVILAVIVGSIVIAVFLPLFAIMNNGFEGGGPGTGNN
jgi:type IV pilus assembly protein PilC